MKKEVNTLLLFRVLLLLVLVVGGVLVLFKGYDMIVAQLRRPRLPGRSIGMLPPSAVSLGAHGRQQLRIATVLMTQLSREETLQPETGKLVQEWLDAAAMENADEARLLDSAFLTLQRIENEDNLVPSISPELRERLRAWLDDYLNRRRDGR